MTIDTLILRNARSQKNCRSRKWSLPLHLMQRFAPVNALRAFLWLQIMQLGHRVKIKEKLIYKGSQQNMTDNSSTAESAHPYRFTITYPVIGV